MITINDGMCELPSEDDEDARLGEPEERAVQIKRAVRIDPLLPVMVCGRVT